MARQFSIYKGLQKPLIYKGFKGKYIVWGIGSLVISLITGGVVGSLTNMILGAVIVIAGFAGGLFLTLQKQKGGLHDKRRHRGVYCIKVSLDKINGYGSKREKVAV